MNLKFLLSFLKLKIFSENHKYEQIIVGGCDFLQNNAFSKPYQEKIETREFCYSLRRRLVFQFWRCVLIHLQSTVVCCMSYEICPWLIPCHPVLMLQQLSILQCFRTWVMPKFAEEYVRCIGQALPDIVSWSHTFHQWQINPMVSLGNTQWRKFWEK